jgi:hypothetical protein
MEKFNSRVVGSFIIWKDYIKFNSSSNGDVSYKQSNTKLTGFMDRYIGLSMVNSNIIISVAVSNSTNKKESDKTAKNVIEQRMISLLKKDYNIDAEDKGVTYVPKELLDMLWKDPYTYKNLYGAIDPTYVNMAVKSV